MQNDRFAHIVKRQRSQLRSLGIGMLVLGIGASALVVGMAFIGETSYAGQAGLGGLALIGAGIGTIWSSRHRK